MGFFSSLFGGGGGGSSASTNNQTTVKVTPITNVDIPLDELAAAIKESSKMQTQAELLKAQEEINQEAQELKALEEQNKKRNHQILLIAVLGGLFLITKGG